MILECLLLALLQDPVKIREWEAAQRRFEAWQKEMLEQRRRPPEELCRILRQKVTVPPLTKSKEEAPKPEPLARLRFRPFFLPGDAPEYELTVGKPDVELSFRGEARFAKVLAYKHRIGVAYSGRDSKLAFLDATEASGVLGGRAQFEAGGQYQLCGHEADAVGGGAALSMDAGLWTVGVGINERKEYSVNVEHGFKGLPKIADRFVRFSAKVGITITAPIALNRVQYGSPYGEDSLGKAGAVARKLPQGIPCPYCAAAGTVTCRRCSDRRTVTCPQCRSGRTESCDRCEGAGALTCPSEVSCETCRGSGRTRCSSCGGSGSVTKYVTVTKTRRKLVIDQIGFNDAGEPVYERHYETESYEEQEERSTNCGVCGGSGFAGGDCGTCGGSGRAECSRCGGMGSVACERCGGSGKLPCSKCDGAGAIPCSGCGGRPIQCPLCRGARRVGP